MPITLKYGHTSYVGATAFDDVCQPSYSKSEYGIDIITRKVRGAAPRLSDYLSSLQQGQPVNFGGAPTQGFPGFGFETNKTLTSFALQTWTTDDDPVYPTVTLTYKGLLNGIFPNPLGNNSQSLQTVTLTCSVTTSDTIIIGGESKVLSGHATRTIQYIANQTDWKYVTNQRLEGGTQTELTGRSPTVLYSTIRDDTLGITFTGQNAPAIYVVALTPAEIIQQTSFTCDPVPGTPYFEASETQTRMYASA